MENIRNKIRYLLGDTSTSGTDTFTYGSSAIFVLTEPNVISVIRVRKNDVSAGVTFVYNASTNEVTVTSSLTAGDTVEIDYTYYPNYSNTELNGFIQATLVHISINNYGNFEYDSTDDTIYPELELREQNLVAAIASILINPDNRTLRLPDITISLPNDLPTNQKISKTIASFKKNSHGILEIL